MPVAGGVGGGGHCPPGDAGGSGGVGVGVGHADGEGDGAAVGWAEPDGDGTGLGREDDEGVALAEGDGELIVGTMMSGRAPMGAVPVAAALRVVVALRVAATFPAAPGLAITDPRLVWAVSTERGTCELPSVSTVTIPVDAAATRMPAAAAAPVTAKIRLGCLTGRGKPAGPNWPARWMTHSR
jgi:hypothetical protein